MPSFLLYILAGVFLLGLSLILVGLRAAPEGHEDEKGFHQGASPADRGAKKRGETTPPQ